jgi:broad specificity phosphatase PhoE
MTTFKENPRIRVYLIRHAESTANLTPETICGQQNHLELTPIGKAQAIALGQLFLDEKITFDFVYTSGARRAQETADHVMQQLRQLGNCPRGATEVCIMNALNEQSQGDWEGKKRADVVTEVYRKSMAEQSFRFVPPGGESLEDVEKRAMVAVRDLCGPNSSVWKWSEINKKTCDVGVFAHGGSIRMILYALINGDRSKAWRTPIENTSITEFSVNQSGTFAVARINDHVHLKSLQKPSASAQATSSRGLISTQTVGASSLKRGSSNSPASPTPNKAAAQDVKELSAKTASAAGVVAVASSNGGEPTPAQGMFQQAAATSYNEKNNSRGIQPTLKIIPNATPLSDHLTKQEQAEIEKREAETERVFREFSAY